MTRSFLPAICALCVALASFAAVADEESPAGGYRPRTDTMRAPLDSAEHGSSRSKSNSAAGVVTPMMTAHPIPQFGTQVVTIAKPSIEKAPAATRENCALQTVASVDLRTLSSGLVTVPVTIQDREAHLVVDTGSVYSVVTQDIVDDIRASTRSARSVLAGNMELMGGVIMDRVVEPRDFRIGALIGKRPPLYVMPSTAMGEDIQGLLGPDIMDKYDIEIDFAFGKFNMISPDHCAGSVVYWTHEPYAEAPIGRDDNRHITIPVVLDGTKMSAVIDTGAEGSAMPLSVAQRLLGIDVKSPGLQEVAPISVNGAQHVRAYRYPFQTLNLEGITVKNPDIVLMPDSGQGVPDLLLGVGILRQLHLYIAYKEGKIYATRAEAR